MRACRTRHKDVIEVLLSASDIDLYAICSKGWTAFMYACQYGRYDIVKMLLDKMNNQVDMNVKDHAYKQTAFMWACSTIYGSYGTGVVKLLLERCHRDVDLELKGHQGRTAFMWACSNGQTEVVRYFLKHFEKNIDLNATDDSGRTACMLADFYNRKDVVKLLENHAKNKQKK